MISAIRNPQSGISLEPPMTPDLEYEDDDEVSADALAQAEDGDD